MKKCFQFKGMSILDHGIDVWNWFDDLYHHLKFGKALNKEWRLPNWIYDLDLSSVNLETMREYLIYHDCGKPFCRTVDDEGRQHFPGHEIVSYHRYKMYSDNEEVLTLIKSDMDAHRLKSEGIEEFLERRESVSLILAALCEIHSNAFAQLGSDGLNSDSFKIKFKKLDKIGKKMKALV